MIKICLLILINIHKGWKQKGALLTNVWSAIPDTRYKVISSGPMLCYVMPEVKHPKNSLLRFYNQVRTPENLKGRSI